jgi:hypothetical protein
MWNSFFSLLPPLLLSPNSHSPCVSSSLFCLSILSLETFFLPSLLLLSWGQRHDLRLSSFSMCHVKGKSTPTTSHHILPSSMYMYNIMYVEIQDYNDECMHVHMYRPTGLTAYTSNFKVNTKCT